MVKSVSKLMDEQFEIGGFKFGLDPLLNLIPVAGDVGSYLISIVMVLTMVKHGASGKLALKMIGNITLDAIVGAIPVLGWIFDFGYKANSRNVKLLAEHYETGMHRGSAKPYVTIILLVFLVALVGIAWLSFKFIRWFIAAVDKDLGLSF